MKFSTIAVSHSAPVAEIRLKRPDRGNPIDRQLLDEIDAAADELDNDPSVLVVLLTAAGEVFSHGWEDASPEAGAAESSHEVTRKRATVLTKLSIVIPVYNEAETIQELVAEALRQHPRAVVFSGQLAFQKETLWTRWLHNYIVFALQRIYCRQGVPFVIVPIRVDADPRRESVENRSV